MPLHVSSNKCSSLGGSNCINTSSGITHSGGWLSDVPVKRKLFSLDRHVRQLLTRVCYTRWCINTIWPSWWWALVARNTNRHEINTLRKSTSSWSLTRITSRCTVNENIKLSRTILRNVIASKGHGRETILFVTSKIIVKMLFFKEYLSYKSLSSRWLHSMTSSTEMS
jgi:hypothetical protein